MKTKILTQSELKELVGGSVDYVEVSKKESENLNTTTECKCTYYDGPKAKNNNKSDICSCECVF